MQPISADAVLQEFRNKVTRNIVWFIAGTTLLLAAVQGWMGHWWQTLMILVAGAIAAAVAWQYRGQRIPTPWRVVLMVALVSITVMSIEKNGSLGVYWSYPLLITAFFMFRGVLAVLVGAVIGALVSVTVFMYMPLADAWRISATLAVIWGFAFIFVVMLGQMQTLLHKLVITDTLTGLENRHRLTEYLGKLIHKYQRYQRPASILMLDIDHFKALNDKHGHLFGDQMLKQLAERLKRSIRSTDKLFRVGGEEFMVVMPETTLTQALAAAEKLRHAVAEKPFAGKDATVSLTVSLGVAELAAEMTWSQWINQADTALLEAKKQGRNQVSQVPTGMPTHDRI